MSTFLKRRDGLTFTKVPDRIADRVDCTPHRLAVTRAIFRLAGLRGYCTATREEIQEAARSTLGTVSQTIAWLKAIGELEQVKDLDVRSRRRLVLIGRDAEGQADAEATHKQSGARQETTMRAPGDNDARARRQRCARQEILPLKEEEISEEKERDVPSPAGAIAPACEARPETGRDECAPLKGEGEAPPSAEEIEAAIAERQAQAAEILARVGSPKALEAPRRSADRACYRLALAEVERLRAGDWSPIRPAPGRRPPEPPPPRCDPKPEVFRPDEGYPLAEAFRLCRELDAPGSGPSKADELAMHLAGRWRDLRAETLDHFRAASASLGSGVLESLIRSCERRAIKNPARYFSSRSGEELAKNRAARLARLVAS